MLIGDDSVVVNFLEVLINRVMMQAEIQAEIEPAENITCVQLAGT